MEILHLFTFVENIHLFGKLVPHIAITSQDFARSPYRETTALPALQTIFVESLRYRDAVHFLPTLQSPCIRLLPEREDNMSAGVR